MSNGNKKRTPAGNSSTPVQRANRRRNRGHDHEADWGTVEASLLLRIVVAVARLGGAVQFGYTRDRGAYVIRILGDGDPFNEYLRSTEDVDYWLEGFAQDYELEGSRPEPSETT